jgi:signal transduction histidine kinase
MSRSPLRAARRFPIRTARLRLTLLYAVMFFLLGTIVLAITYVLASYGTTIRVSANRAAAHPVPGSGALIAAAVSSAARAAAQAGVNQQVVLQHSADLRRLLAVSWFVLAVTTVAAALLGWFASGRVLRPLRQMTATARTISAGNLGQRLALTGPEDEFKALGDTLDDLLARLQASFEAQRRFVGNASHELRTPLTLERTLLQVALADPKADVATLRATCEELLASGRDQERLLEALLTLATSERGLEQREPVDLAALAGHVLLTQRPTIQRNGVHATSVLTPAATVGDPALVERLIANLIDNAASHNFRGGTLDVTTATRDGRAVLSVTNTGATISADELERLFEPFQRLDGRRASGADGHHGLGLSIVRAIATAHGATIDARPQPGGGLAITVGFSGADEAPA